MTQSQEISVLVRMNGRRSARRRTVNVYPKTGCSRQTPGSPAKLLANGSIVSGSVSDSDNGFPLSHQSTKDKPHKKASDTFEDSDEDDWLSSSNYKSSNSQVPGSSNQESTLERLESFRNRTDNAKLGYMESDDTDAGNLLRQLDLSKVQNKPSFNLTARNLSQLRSTVNPLSAHRVSSLNKPGTTSVTGFPLQSNRPLNFGHITSKVDNKGIDLLKTYSPCVRQTDPSLTSTVDKENGGEGNGIGHNGLNNGNITTAAAETYLKNEELSNETSLAQADTVPGTLSKILSIVSLWKELVYVLKENPNINALAPQDELSVSDAQKFALFQHELKFHDPKTPGKGTVTEVLRETDESSPTEIIPLVNKSNSEMKNFPDIILESLSDEETTSSQNKVKGEWDKPVIMKSVSPKPIPDFQVSHRSDNHVVELTHPDNANGLIKRNEIALSVIDLSESVANSTCEEPPSEGRLQVPMFELGTPSKSSPFTSSAPGPVPASSPQAFASLSSISTWVSRGTEDPSAYVNYPLDKRPSHRFPLRKTSRRSSDFQPVEATVSLFSCLCFKSREEN